VTASSVFRQSIQFYDTEHLFWDKHLILVALARLTECLCAFLLQSFALLRIQLMKSLTQKYGLMLHRGKP